MAPSYSALSILACLVAGTRRPGELLSLLHPTEPARHALKVHSSPLFFFVSSVPQVGLFLGCLDSVCLFARTGRQTNSSVDARRSSWPDRPPESAASQAPLRNLWPLLPQPWPLGVQAFPSLPCLPGTTSLPSWTRPTRWQCRTSAELSSLPSPNSNNSTTTINPTQLISAQSPSHHEIGQEARPPAVLCTCHQAFSQGPPLRPPPSHSLHLCFIYVRSACRTLLASPRRTAFACTDRDWTPMQGTRSRLLATDLHNVPGKTWTSICSHDTRPGLPVLLCTCPPRLIIRYIRPEHGDPVERSHLRRPKTT